MDNKHFWYSIAMSFSGVLLLYLGFLVNPIGTIEYSVISAVGELLIFAGALIGVNIVFKRKDENV